MTFNRKQVPKTKIMKVQIPDGSTTLELKVISGDRFLYFEDSGSDEMHTIELHLKNVGDPIADNEFWLNNIGSAEIKAVYKVIA